MKHKAYSTFYSQLTFIKRLQLVAYNTVLLNYHSYCINFIFLKACF